MGEELIKWEDFFSVNSDILDEQHKQLFELVNKLYDAINNKKDHLILSQIVNALFDYSKYHLETEEAMMEKAFFPELSTHKKYHKFFITQVELFKVKITEGKEEISFTILEFAADWLRTHVLGEDRKFAKYLKEFNN